jgi:hypothetical protein
LHDHDGRKLLDVRSEGFQGLWRGSMSRLEPAFNVHAWLAADAQVVIELPRLGLTFTLAGKNFDRLKSREWPDFWVQGTQDVGTIHGFDRFMVLQHDGGPGVDSVVILPHGDVQGLGMGEERFA